jgi:hypothetical protein
MGLLRNVGRYVGILRTTGCERLLMLTALVVASFFALDIDQELAERWIAERKHIIETYPGVIGRLKSTREGRAAAEAVKERLARARAGNDPPPTIDDKLSVGAVGTLPGLRFKLRERVSGDEARIGIGRQSGRIDVMLTRFDFSKMVDGQIQSTEECFIVTETRTYQSVAGPRTVFVLAPFDAGKARVSYRQAIALELAEAKQTEAERAQRLERTQHEKQQASPRGESQKDAALLTTARDLGKAGLYTAAEQRLRKIIADVPGTPLAAEAQRELDALPPH